MKGDFFPLGTDEFPEVNKRGFIVKRYIHKFRREEDMKKKMIKPRVSLAATFMLGWFLFGGSGRVSANETRVNTYTISNQSNPSVAMDADGDFVVSWESYGQSGGAYAMSDVYAQRFNSNGSPVGGEFAVFATSWDQRNPATAMDSAGNFTIVYEHNQRISTIDNFEIWGKRYNTNGVFVDNLLVNSDPGDQRFPSIAMNSIGIFVVSWSSNDGNENGIYARRYNNAGTAQGDAFLVNTSTDGEQTNSSTAIDGGANFVVVWEDRGGLDGDGFGIFAQRYNGSGTTVGNEFSVNTSTTGNQLNPSVAMSDYGNFIVVWEDRGGNDGDGYGIFAQRYNASGGAVGDEFRVNTYTTGNQSNPSVAMDNVGNFVVSWESFGQDGSLQGVYAQKYNISGAVLDTEFRVNVTSTGSQRSSAVAADNSGRFVTAWQGPDGNGDGVFISWPIIVGCTDLDGDGFGVGDACLGADCDDSDGGINPKAIEVCDDGVDNNCNGLVDIDDDDCLYPPDIYVDDDTCPGAGAGTYGNPYCSIQAAITNSISGQVILVRDGFYRENIDFLGKPIVVRSQFGPESTIIDGDLNGDGFGTYETAVMFVNGESSSTVLKGFTIQHGHGWGYNGGGLVQKDAGGIKCYQSSPTISDCIIKNNSVTGQIGYSVRGGGIRCSSGASPTVTNCIITSNTSTGGGAGISAASSSSPVITDCRISSNENAGYYSYGGAGMFLAGGSPKVTGCTISNNKTVTEGAGIAIASSNVTVKNCLIRNNELSGTDAIGAGIFIEGVSTPTISNCSIIGNKNTGYNGGGIYLAKYSDYDISPLYVVNCTFAGNDAADGVSFYTEKTWNYDTTISNSILWNDTAGNEINGHPIVSYSDVRMYSDPYQGVANINVDPLFADPANGNYHLQIGSPCIDTGTATGAPADDIDGDSRPQQGKMGFQSDDGQEFDRGSDEYVWVGCISDADCEDDNACTDDSCVAGDCVNANNDNNQCSDGNPCNEGDYCSAGECISGTAMDCSSGERCIYNYEVCGDEVDNDCDGRIDGDDEYCGACFLDYYPTEQSFDHNGGADEFNIYIGETCYRDAITSIEDSNWIEIPEDNWGQGDTTIPYTVSANILYESRTGNITIRNHATQENKIFTITQSGKPCDLTVPGDFGTIQEAIDASLAIGCTITVGPGTYNENLKLYHKSITIRSANGPSSTIIDGDGTNAAVSIWYSDSSDSVLDGFTIRHGTQGLYFYQTTAQATNCIVTENTATNGGAGIYCYTASPIISDTIISSNINSGFLGGGGILSRQNSSPTIKNCTIRNNEATSSSSGGGVNCRDNSTLIISNSVISGNSATQSGGGLNVYDATSSLSLTNCVIAKNTSSSGGGLYCSGGSLEIVNSTITENLATRGGGVYNNASAKVTITNSILWGDTAEDPRFPPETNLGNEVYPITYNPDAFNITYSDVDQEVSGQGSVYPGVGNIRSNPLFAGSANGDYHLTSTSPCLDSGTDDTETYPDLPTNDLDGNSRPWDGDKDGIAERDMGAYELLSETKPTTTGGETTFFIDGEVTITFDTITSAGETTVTVLPGDPASPPQGFQVLGRYYDISTTAIFTGMLEVCLHYDPAGLTEEQQLALQILHYEEIDGEDQWVDITSSRDIGEHKICGQTGNLSPFVLVTKNLDINISLNSGWNLISLNVDPPNTAIGEVLGTASTSCNSVWGFNNGWKAFYPAFPGYSDLDNMEAGWGYWLNMSVAAPLTVSAPASSDPISLVEGWNLVGYNSAISLPIAEAIGSIDTYCESVWAYKDGVWKAYYPLYPQYSDLDVMAPHYGYWIKINQACTWTLP